jgi:hypothetical protein
MLVACCFDLGFFDLIVMGVLFGSTGLNYLQGKFEQ